MTKKTRTLAMVVVAALAGAPFFVIVLSPWDALGGVVLMALLPLLIMATVGLSALVKTAGATVAVVLIALLLSSTGPLLPWLGTAFVVALALLSGTLVRIGRQGIGALVLTVAAYLMTNGAKVSTPFTNLDAVTVAFVIAGVVAIGCAWTIAVLSLATRKVEIPTRTVPEPDLPYTVLLTVLTGVFTFVTLQWFPGTSAWWAVLTVAVILRPTGDRMRARLLARVAGTVLGGALALVLVWLIPAEVVAPIAGGLAALLLITSKLLGWHYWIYAIFLTMTVIMLTFTPDTIVAGDITRVGITVGAAIISAAAAVVAGWFMSPREPVDA